MGVRIEFEVKKLPQSYVTMETIVAFENDGDSKDRKGNQIKKMVQKQVESRGGWLFIIRGKPGHSIRLTSEDQVEALKLALTPRLINTETGEECNEQGIPLSVLKVVGESHDSGRIETDVDVEKSDEQLEIDLTNADEAAVGAQIEKLE